MRFRKEKSRVKKLDNSNGLKLKIRKKENMEAAKVKSSTIGVPQGPCSYARAHTDSQKKEHQARPRARRYRFTKESKHQAEIQ